MYTSRKSRVVCYQSILAMDADLAASGFRVSHTHLKYTGIVRGLMTAVLIEG